MRDRPALRVVQGLSSAKRSLRCEEMAIKPIKRFIGTDADHNRRGTVLRKPIGKSADERFKAHTRLIKWEIARIGNRVLRWLTHPARAGFPALPFGVVWVSEFCVVRGSATQKNCSITSRYSFAHPFAMRNGAGKLRFPINKQDANLFACMAGMLRSEVQHGR